ncbi:phosphodiester glycosidase family protein [Iningainema tapete]|uniref:Phosphodiester glycosidase family protein n=1 Tax=Iningainema tapete BLCC-T55 TaxID=2748662 RepID=A0A8J7CFH4_9CYAN|nr:phosphodiester glycosidase family protein [Iningainema tapete]MBD2774915.1 phosphodiester glycosidase family protein [Iningainema tapete BLCC-T55]
MKIHNWQQQYQSTFASRGKSKLIKVMGLAVLSLVLCLIVTTYTNSSTKLLAETNQKEYSVSGVISAGNQISLNGRTYSGAWLVRRTTNASLKTYLSDGVISQLMGVDLLDSNHPNQQQVKWFSSPQSSVLLASILAGGYRYLDISPLTQTAAWQLQVYGDTLVISTPTAKVVDINDNKQDLSSIVVTLDRPVSWQVSQQGSRGVGESENEGGFSVPRKDWAISIDGIADPSVLQRYNPLTDVPAERLYLIKQVQVINNQTIIHLSVPVGLSVRVSSLANPNRLIIDIRADTLVQRSITWASGLRWQQQYRTLNQERFAVVWLEINPRTSGLKLKPIWTQEDTLVGTAPIIQTAQKTGAYAAINGGYFNRNNRLPLGAIRRDGQWLSSPILNRGAIAWNDAGQFYIARLVWQETLIGANNLQLPISNLNSGYVQSGLARYTPSWGVTYTPLTDNEIIFVVQKNQVTNQLPGGKAGETTIPIPPNGYLLTLRGNTTGINMPIGSSVRIVSTTNPSDFSRYPHILGAGPVLLLNRQIVLDGKGEKFNNAFITQKAIRSGICTTGAGNLIIAAVHNRVGGAGPNLAEHAQLMQQLGCINALNLDGGSSTSLYLGGQLLDRFPSTAARIHNAIGIFLQQK